MKTKQWSEMSKKEKILGSIGLIFILFVVLGLLARPSKETGTDQSATQPEQQEESQSEPPSTEQPPQPEPEQPTPPSEEQKEEDQESLSYKIRHRECEFGDILLITGEFTDFVTVGEDADGVFGKLGESGNEPVVEQDPEFETLIEHRYGDDYLLFAREPEKKAYYILWDVY